MKHHGMGNTFLVEEGLVGFFDILGYQNIIENNRIEEMVRLISDIIKNLLNQVPKVLADQIQGTKKTEYVKRINELRCLLISDSILLTLPFSSKSNDINRIRDWNAFILYVARLQRDSFDCGLPMRGAISVGQFYIDDEVKGKTCFAGKPITEAYKLSNGLKFAGCALTDNAEKQFFYDIQTVKKEKSVILRSLLFPYLAPHKDGDKKIILTNWFLPFPGWGSESKDLRQDIVVAFHSHNKDVSKSALDKLEYTEIILRHSLGRTWQFEHIEKK